MNDRQRMEREVVVAWDGWPIPEMIGGAVVGAILLLTFMAVPPQLRGLLPDAVIVVAGALIGMVVSYVFRPRRIRARTRRLSAEEQHLTRAA